MNNRMIWRKMIWIVCWAIAPCIVPETLRIHPESPKPGEPVTFEYRDTRSFQSVNLIIIPPMTASADTLPMKAENGRWILVFPTDIKQSLIVFRLEGTDAVGNHVNLSDGQPSQIMLVTDSGLPVRGACYMKAMLWNGSGNWITPDPDSAFKAIGRELELYPDHYIARLYQYSMLLQHEGASDATLERIHRDIGSMLRRGEESVELLKFGISAYQMIRDEEAAEEVRDLLIEIEPDHQQESIREFNEIMALDDADEQADRLEEFLVLYPESRLTEIALSQLVSVQIEMDDSTALLGTGDELLEKASTMAGASGLSALAGILAEKNWQLNKAWASIERALEIIRNVDTAQHPAEISKPEWEERIRYTQARYEGIAGWIRYHQNRFPEALTLLENAAGRTMEPGLLFHLAETRMAMGKEEQAIAAYGRVVGFGGEMAEMAYEKLNRIWQKTGRPASGLDSLLNREENQIRDDYKIKILKLRSVRPAPDFTFKKLNGGSLAPGDIQGKKWLFCFWATWSDGSARMLEALEEVMQNRDDVQVLAVSVDEKSSDISRYVRDNKLGFQVALINDRAEKNFQLKGVPVLLVLDTEANIHFEHKGFRPDLVQVLHIELDDMN